MPRQAIATSLAPAAIGPYSQAVRCGNTVYLSGQIPLDPATGELVQGDFSAQTTRVFENLRAVITAAGGSFDDVVRRSEEHTSELQSLMRKSYAVFCLKKKTQMKYNQDT